MRTTTYQQILSWDWEEIVVKDENDARVEFWAATISFTENLTIRGKAWQNEQLLTPDYSPIEVEWATNNWFPFEVKWTWTLNIVTIN